MTAVVLGDLNVDLELVLPDAGSLDHRNPDPVISGGGSAANTAAALARLGVATEFVGTVGRDAFGDAATAALEEHGVDVSGVERGEGSTVAVIVVVPPDGERIIYVWPPRGGAHLEIDAERAEAAVVAATWVHVSGIALRGEPAAGSIIAAMERARAAGIPVSLDLNLRLDNWGWESGFRSVIGAAVEASNVVFGGIEEEILPLTGEATLEGGLAALSAGGRVAVGRMGAAGAVASDGGDPIVSSGFEVPVVDTVGAGDAFDAGFIASRLAGHSLEECLDAANAVGALSVTHVGARSTPTRAEVDALLTESGRR